MKEVDYIKRREVRDYLVDRYEVLEKVKDLLLIPGTDLMSTEQVANYYEVSERQIKALYANHKKEIDSDGSILLNRDYFDGKEVNCTSVNKEQSQVTYLFKNGQQIIINNRGLRAFSKRGVLRIGMLLRDSVIAKEIRTQLLNITEKTTEQVRTQDINEEQKLLLNVGMAYSSGNIDSLLKATTEYNVFQNRHIQQLEESNNLLQTKNTQLTNDNKALAGQILTWTDRSKLNAGIRKLSAETGVFYGKLWNELYRNLKYKYGLDIKHRGSSPYIQWVKEREWGNIIKTFCALCESYEQSPTEMFQQNLHNLEGVE